MTFCISFGHYALFVSDLKIMILIFRNSMQIFVLLILITSL